MSGQDNPFAPAGSAAGYGTTNVGYGAPSSSPVPAPSGPLIKDSTTAEFNGDVIDTSRQVPVLVDFWAPWCEPCKQLTPIIEAAVQQAGGKVRFVKMNIDDHPTIAGQMGIKSLPAVVAFIDGKPADAFMGVKSASEVAAFIEKTIKASGADAQAEMIEAAFAQAAAAIEAEDINGAAQIYRAILQQMPDNPEAYGALAGLMADYGQPEQAQGMLDQAPDVFAGHPALASVKAKLELAAKVAALGDPDALQKRLQADSKDYDAAFDLAQINNAQGDRMGAADLLLSIMEADREWREDGARKELLTFFEAWGPMDKATQSARRKLSSLLFR